MSDVTLDILFESFHAAIIGCIFVYLIFQGKRLCLGKNSGWRYILIGFGMLFFGTLMDITDNFHALNSLIVIGDTKYEAFIEKVFGYTLGSLMLAIGFWKFLPAILALREREDRLKAIELELRELNRELEQRVQSRTTQLQESLREQEAFSYSVSHDLRAPLRHINSYSAMLQEEYQDLLPDQANNYLDRIHAASDRMGILINDLLQLSRISRTEIQCVTVSLSAIARNVVEMLQISSPARTVQVEIAADLIAQGDPTLLRQMLENLLGNAWKYTAFQHNARIEFGREGKDTGHIFFIRDNGAGFDMTYADKLFQPFQRLHGKEFEGTGIGLATVKRVVERHDGKIWAESTLNQGATFYFSLPGTCV